MPKPDTRDRGAPDDAMSSLLGARPAADGFKEARGRMLARLLNADPLVLPAAPEPRPDDEVPDAIGHYVIHARIGRGGMGVVYRAYDPSLDRDLALKLISGPQAATEADEQARLLREARAMARVTHPNVVTVHEVGDHKGQVYIAMEYVPGGSLTSWLDRAEDRSWREIIAMFLAAGEGLAAAHAAGVTHRDFKPDNVLVGENGVVKVADFGLAWAGAREPDSFEPTLRDAAATLESGAITLVRTVTGAVLGTPGYMSPEQYRGERPSVAADQFSFCVSLYKALYGRLPFDASRPETYRERVLGGELLPQRAGSRTPRWLYRVVTRGLSVAPRDRWPSMEALLSRLRRGPRRAWIPALTITLAVSGVAALGVVGGASEQGCRPAAELLEDVWDVDARARLEQRFLASTSSAASVERVWRSLSRLLDQHVARWTVEYAHVCEIEDERGRAAALECLEDGRARIEAFTSIVAGAEPAVIDASLVAVTGLPAPERCRQTATPQRGWGEPASRQDQRLLAARTQLMRAQVDIGFHRLGAAQSVIDDVLQSARAADSDALEAEALLTLGRAQRGAGENKAAHESFRAARALTKGVGERRALDLRILIQLIDLIGVEVRDLAGAEALAEEARVLASLLGHPSLLEAYLANNLARVYRAHRHYAEASDGYVTAYALLKQTLGDAAPETIAVRSNLGVVLSLQGAPEAVAVLEHALEQQLSVLGEHHPRTPNMIRSLGNALGRQREFDRAAAVLARGAELREQLRGAEDPMLPFDLLSLARAQRGAGALAAASKTLSRAIRLNDAGARLNEQAFASERAALEDARARVVEMTSP